MKLLVLSLYLGLVMLLCAPAAWAEIYKYTDENGRLVFVDNESKIPPQYREDKTTISDLPTPQATPQSKPSPTTEPTAAMQNSKKEQQAYQMSVRIHGNRVIVPVTVATSNNRFVNLMLLLDTGATRTVLHRDALKRLKIPKGEKVLARIAGGKTLASEKVLFHYIKVGPYRQEDMFAMVIDPQGAQAPFDGMLGMDFLRSHPYVIDYDEQIISWELVE